MVFALQKYVKFHLSVPCQPIDSGTGAELNLKPHAWSHACNTVDVESGYVMVVMKGVITQNTTITSKDFTESVQTVFQNNLVLGLGKEKFSFYNLLLFTREAY